jgi:hypothetical protein
LLEVLPPLDPEACRYVYGSREREVLTAVVVIASASVGSEVANHIGEGIRLKITICDDAWVSSALPNPASLERLADGLAVEIIVIRQLEGSNFPSTEGQQEQICLIHRPAPYWI